jgi:hypothetical protein
MSENLIVNSLPKCYRDRSEMEEIANALTAGIDEGFQFWSVLLAYYETDRLEPETCFPEWLDMLARWGGWGDLWDASWQVDVKRSLLANTDYIWRNRGNKKILPFLFQLFNLNASLVPSSGFILGVTRLNNPLGSDPFSWIIQVPPSYAPNTSDRSLVEKLAKNFLPCWCYLQIQFTT